VDGTPEWVGVQLDQTAMPIMLGWKLWKLGWLPETEVKAYYGRMLKPAADFLVKGGKVGLGWNSATITPPFTQQERWEEQGGYSPSTTAAVIAGLVVAGDIAETSGDATSAALYRQTADDYSAKVEARMVTTKGAFGDGHYYLRLNSDQDPDNKSPVEERNGQAAVAEDKMLDAGFLELVRYGVRRADDPATSPACRRSTTRRWRTSIASATTSPSRARPEASRAGGAMASTATAKTSRPAPTMAKADRCVPVSAAECGRSSPGSAGITSWRWPVCRESRTRRP